MCTRKKKQNAFDGTNSVRASITIRAYDFRLYFGIHSLIQPHIFSFRFWLACKRSCVRFICFVFSFFCRLCARGALAVWWEKWAWQRQKDKLTVREIKSHINLAFIIYCYHRLTKTRKMRYEWTVWRIYELRAIHFRQFQLPVCRFYCIELQLGEFRLFLPEQEKACDVILLFNGNYFIIFTLKVQWKFYSRFVVDKKIICGPRSFNFSRTLP